MLRTPPSMYLSPSIVIGGQKHGAAVLAAIARSNGAPEDASQIWSFPVRAFTVMTRSLSGQALPMKGVNIDLEIDASSLTVGASSAIFPISARSGSESGEIAARGHDVSQNGHAEGLTRRGRHNVRRRTEALFQRQLCADDRASRGADD